MSCSKSLPPACQTQSAPSRTLICVDFASQGFLRLNLSFPFAASVAVFQNADQIFDLLWHDPTSIATIVLDSCVVDFEEVFYASLHHTHIRFVVRSSEIKQSNWYYRLTQRPNVQLEYNDFMF